MKKEIELFDEEIELLPTKPNEVLHFKIDFEKVIKKHKLSKDDDITINYTFALGEKQ